MADDVTVDNGALTDYNVATDEATGAKHIALTKLAYSADGDRTHVPADVDGLLVNLGTNNDVRLTDGTDVALVTADGKLNTETDLPADQTGSGSITANGQTVEVTVDKGRSAFAWQITGTWTGTIIFEMTVDGTNYEQHSVYSVTGANGVESTTGNGIFLTGIGAAAKVRVRSTAWTSGTANINHSRSQASTQAQVIKAPLPAGNNNIGDVDINSLPAVGQTNMAGAISVAIASDQSAVPVSGTVTANAGTGPFPVSDNAGSLTVDAPVGTPVATRLSDGTSFLTTTGGRLSVDASAVAVPVTDNSGSLTVDNGGTFAVQDSEKVADNAAFTDGTTKVQPSGYIFDEVAGTALTENDVAAARIDSKRAQVGIIEDATTRGRWATVTAANALKTDGSAVTQPVSGTVTANAGTGSFTVAQATAANLKSEPAGAVAHDGVMSSTVNPIVVGVRSDTIADVAVGSQVSADDDITQLRADRNGAMFVMPYGPRQWHYTNQSSATQTDTSAHTAPGAGLSLYITSIYVAVNGAVTITCEEGTATFKWRYYGAAAGDGAAVTFPAPMKITANTSFTYTTSGAIEHTITITGFIAPG